jgi:hypothetical protein
LISFHFPENAALERIKALELFLFGRISAEKYCHPDRGPGMPPPNDSEVPQITAPQITATRWR